MIFHQLFPAGFGIHVFQLLLRIEHLLIYIGIMAMQSFLPICYSVQLTVFQKTHNWHMFIFAGTVGIEWIILNVVNYIP